MSNQEENTPLLPVAVNKAKSVWNDFKSFVDKGNVLDLAVGVVIGAAFSDIVTSFVQDLLTPVLGLVVTSELSESFLVIKKGPNFPYNTRIDAKEDGAVTWNYGNFLQLSFNFLLVSVSLYFVVKIVQKSRKKRIDNGEDLSIKECPFCYSAIDGRATKCKNCTSSFSS